MKQPRWAELPPRGYVHWTGMITSKEVASDAAYSGR